MTAAAAPPEVSAPAEGDVWFDTTTRRLKLRRAGRWWIHPADHLITAGQRDKIESGEYRLMVPEVKR